MSASSDKMLDLLQQLSALNELEDQSRSDSKDSSDSKGRQSTRKKIRAEMKQLASHARQESSK